MAVQARNKKIILAVCILLVALALTACSSNAKKEREVREQAIGFLQQGDYSAAVARFDEALSYHDGKYTDLELDILKYRAEAEVMAGDYPSAANTFAMLRKNDEDKPEYINLQIICMVRGDGSLEKALELYESIDASNPESIGHREALYALGSALAKSDNQDYIDKSVEIYRRALSIDSEKSGELYNRIGSLVFAQGNIDEAIGWFNDGVDFISTKEYAEGEDTEEDVLQSLKYNIAICYEYKQDYAKALELFNAYVSTYGSNETIEHEIEFLESRIR